LILILIYFTPKNPTDTRVVLSNSSQSSNYNIKFHALHSSI